MRVTYLSYPPSTTSTFATIPKISHKPYSPLGTFTRVAAVTTLTKTPNPSGSMQSTTMPVLSLTSPPLHQAAIPTQLMSNDCPKPLLAYPRYSSRKQTTSSATGPYQAHSETLLGTTLKVSTLNSSPCLIT